MKFTEIVKKMLDYCESCPKNETCTDYCEAAQEIRDELAIDKE